MKSNLMIKTRSNVQLNKLNESEIEGNNKYIFKGCFTQCSEPGHIVENRNGRIYQANEVLRHLPYLRDRIKSEGCILGELDHPENRFDISLKEASHKITDLWYDQHSRQVQGKLELLSTPNGEIAKNLVDAGFPLFVSSRAAGDVDEKTHEVEIAQIFTYDIVCTPGFEEARLDRVNESLKPAASHYLNESVKLKKASSNDNEKYNITDPNVQVYNLKDSVQINENKTYKMKDVTMPLLEEDQAAVDPVNRGVDIKQADLDKAAEEAGVSIKPLDPASNQAKEGESISHADALNDAEDKKENADENQNREDRKKLVLDIKGVEKVASDKEANAVEEEKEEKKSLILGIKKESKKEDEDSSKDDSKEEEPKEEPKEEVKEEEMKQSKLSKEVSKDEEKVDDLIARIQKKAEVKESIVSKFPFSISLSDENFRRFAKMSADDKFKCNNFVVEHQIYDIETINDMFDTPLKEEKKVLENWVRLASKEDLELFKKAPKEVQDAIEESAKFVVLETQADVDEFWERTGLRQQAMQKEINEQFVNKYKDVITPHEVENDDLGYNAAYIKMIEDVMMQDK